MRLLNRIKAALICSWRGHHFRNRYNVRTFFCTRCGQVDPSISYPDPNEITTLGAETITSLFPSKVDTD